MIFMGTNEFGTTDDIFLGTNIIAYMNMERVKTIEGVTVGNATAMDKNVQISLKKCYSEYLERVYLGLPLLKSNITETINFIQRKKDINLISDFGYGTHSFGHNDTTGSAAGSESVCILQKAVLELIEKNEVFCFWYGRAGKYIEENEYIKTIINSLGFKATEFYCFLLNEISNFYTIIVMGFYENKLITTGVSCCNDMKECIYKAFQEARIVEWQQYNNGNSNFDKFSANTQREYYKFVQEKTKYMNRGLIQNVRHEKLKLAKWIQNIWIKLIYADVRRNVKMVKCISDELLTALPTKSNIVEASQKDIIIRYYKDCEVDCPIV